MRPKKIKYMSYPYHIPHSTRIVPLSQETPGICTLVVQWMIGVSQIKDDTGVRLSTTTVGELLAEVDSPVKAQATIIIDIDVQRLEVSRGIDDADLAGLNKVIGDHEVLLVRSDLDIMRTHGGLVLVGIIQALDVVQVADV